MDTENNVQIGGMRNPLKNIFGYQDEGRGTPTFPKKTTIVEKEGFTTSDIDYLALIKDGDYEKNKMKLRTRQLFSMIPWNATPVDIGLSLRGVLKEGYGGYAAGDVIFVSDERSIVIQTIYTREIVTIGKKVFKRWNSYNEVFFVCEYVRDPRIVSTDGLNFMFKSINADRFKNNEFGSRFLVSKDNSYKKISKGNKIILGSSVSYPVDRILKDNDMDMTQIDEFWNTLKEKYEANDVKYLNKLLSFKKEDTELLQTEFKIRSNISYEIEEFKIEEGKVGTFNLLDKDGKAISHEANNLGDLKNLLTDWEITEFNKAITTTGIKRNLGELYYKIERGGVYGHVKYSSVDGISGIMDDGTEIKKINPGDKLVFLHPANGLLSTPEFGYSVIYDNVTTDDPSNTTEIKLLIKNESNGTAVAGLIYREWNKITVDTDKILNHIYKRGLQLNIDEDTKYNLNIYPMLWEHTLSIRWGEGGARFTLADGAYKTVVKEKVRYAYDNNWEDIEEFKREDEFLDIDAEDDAGDDVDGLPTAGKSKDKKKGELLFISKKKLDFNLDKIFDKIDNWRKEKSDRIEKIPEEIPRIKDIKDIFKGDVEKLLEHVIKRIKENWRGGNTLEYNIFVDLLQFGLDISSKNTVIKIIYILLLKNKELLKNVDESTGEKKIIVEELKQMARFASIATGKVEDDDAEINGAKNLIIELLKKNVIAEELGNLKPEEMETGDIIEKLENIKKNGVIKEFINMLKGLIKDGTMHEDYNKIIEVLTSPASLPETEKVLTKEDVQKKSEKMLRRLNKIKIEAAGKIQKTWRNAKRLKELKKLSAIECRTITIENTDLIFIQKSGNRDNRIENLIEPYLDLNFNTLITEDMKERIKQQGRISDEPGAGLRTYNFLVNKKLIKDELNMSSFPINNMNCLDYRDNKWQARITDKDEALELYKSEDYVLEDEKTDKIFTNQVLNKIIDPPHGYNLIKITKDDDDDETNFKVVYEFITINSIYTVLVQNFEKELIQIANLKEVEDKANLKKNLIAMKGSLEEFEKKYKPSAFIDESTSTLEEKRLEYLNAYNKVLRSKLNQNSDMFFS